MPSPRYPNALARPGVFLLGTLVAACGDGRTVPQRGEPAGADSLGPGAPTPARYVTTVAFAGSGSRPAQLFARFANETSFQTLTRDYTAWLSDENGWQPLLSLQDTLPVPRAGWRVLPGNGLRVRVADGAEFLALSFDTERGDVTLVPGGVVTDWTGLTGQRAYLGVATLERGGRVEEGLVFFWRAARPASAPAIGRTDRILLLADTLGNGMMIEGNAEARGAITLWSWLGGVEATWTDVAFSPIPADDRLSGDEPDDEAAPRGWTLEIAQVGLAGLIRVVEPAGTDSLSGRWVPSRVYRVEGEVSVEGQVFRFNGIGLESPLP